MILAQVKDGGFSDPNRASEQRLPRPSVRPRVAKNKHVGYACCCLFIPILHFRVTLCVIVAPSLM